MERRFGIDNYGNLPLMPPSGEPTANDTLNTLAFGLSTGTAQALRADHLPTVISGQSVTH